MRCGGDVPLTDAARKDRSGALSFRVVGFGLGALAVVALVVGLGAYFELLRYRRVAAHHVPADAVVAARIDVEQVVVYEPVRKHLVPLIDSLGSNGAGRVERLRKQGGVNLGLELREIVVAVGPTARDWVVVVGGLFDDRVLDHLETVVRSEGTPVTRQDGTLVLGRKIVAARADDNALVFGPSLENVRRALPAQPTYGRLGLEDTGPGGFAVARLPIPQIDQGVPGLQRGTQVRAVGRLSLGPEMALTVHVDLAGPSSEREASQFAAELRGSLDTLRRFAAQKGPVRITSSGSRVELTIPLDVDGLDRAAAAMASALGGWLASQ